MPLLVTGLLLPNRLGGGLPPFGFRGSDLLAARCQGRGNRARARRRLLDSVIDFERCDDHALRAAVKRQFQAADVAAVGRPETGVLIEGAMAHFSLADGAAPRHEAVTVSLLRRY